MHPGKRRKRILIVEDEAFVAEVVKCALEDQYDIDWAADAAGAVAQMTGDPPDLAIVDCLLPGGSLGKILRKADVLGAPAVLMSGHDELLHQFVAFGYPCLRKPFELDALLQAVDGALHGRWAELRVA